ncbi:MAG: hypothetical protein R3C56_08045 [Pirellulaceae bacterium]
MATAAERLTIAQTGDLIEAGEINEAALTPTRKTTRDEAEDRMVATTGPQHAATLTTQRLHPARPVVWPAHRGVAATVPRHGCQSSCSTARASHIAAEQLQETKDLRATQLAARRFLATELGGQFQLFMSDLYLERGWGIAASQAVESIRGETRVGANSPPGNLSLWISGRPPWYGNNWLLAERQPSRLIVASTIRIAFASI